MYCLGQTTFLAQLLATATCFEFWQGEMREFDLDLEMHFSIFCLKLMCAFVEPYGFCECCFLMEWISLVF